MSLPRRQPQGSVPASGLPLVSVVIPCRDEERFIAGCLDSLVGNDYPKERLEILVVDGASTDTTRLIVQRYAERYPFIRLIDNPRKIIPTGMNLGIRHARGDVILKIDAHASYLRDYISKCVRFQTEYDADNVGGVIVTRARSATAMAKAIALALSHPFGSGNSHFRIGSREPRWADTAAFGCYKRDVFARVGLYNEALVRSSDMDLNTRLRRAGGRILLVPEIVAYYYPRAELGDFFRRNLLDGFWALYPLKFGGQVARVRHVAPLVALLAFAVVLAATPLSRPARYALAGLIGTYVLLAVGSSAQIAWRQRDPRLVMLLPIVFAVRHLAYALGSTWGWLRCVASPGFWTARNRSPWREASF